MTYRGVVRGTVIEFETGASLPEGTRVEVVVNAPPEDERAAGGHPKGSRRALLAAMDAPPRCTSRDVDDLLRAIQEGRHAVQYRGVFDSRQEQG